MRVAGKEAAREAQNRGRGYCRVAGLARSGPGVALASLMSIFAQGPGSRSSPRERSIPLLDGVFPARAENPNRRHRLRHAPDLGLATG